MITREYRKKDFYKIKEMNARLIEHGEAILPLGLREFEELENSEKALDYAAGLGGKRGWKCFVCEDGGDLAGFITGRISEEIPGYRIHRWGRVEMFFVDEAFRRRGAGGMLMRRMEEWFSGKGCGGTAVETWTSNRGARMAYKRMGFSEIAVTLVKKTGGNSRREPGP